MVCVGLLDEIVVPRISSILSLSRRVFSSVGNRTPTPCVRPPDALAALRVPTLFVVGSDDALFPPVVIREAAAQVPGARVVEIADAGHSPYFEQPEDWNRAVLGFLEEHGAG